MKKAALAALMISAPLFAQENTLFHGKMEHGGFGGPVWKMDMVSGEARIFTGGRGGWIINHTVVLGGGGSSMISEMKTDLTYEESPLFMRMDYSGFEIEYQ